ncbi:unnamed protein product [Allacma fusca]|uniref:Uncharacterized protein n=1 Tax=Allacma fusca TaxID=39272 RepID=A0A8J2Q1F2_9HEXA|nr:unnamed protein product [Allacma fusca]
MTVSMPGYSNEPAKPWKLRSIEMTLDTDLFDGTMHTGDEDKDRGKCIPCCDFPLRWFSLGVALTELFVSLSSAIYTTYGIFHYANYDSEILLHDELYVEARKHYAGKFSNVPMGFIYWDLSLFTVESALAVYLLYGLAKVQVCFSKHG